MDEAKMVVSSRVKGKIGADYYKVYYGDSNLIGKYKRKTFCSVIYRYPEYCFKHFKINKYFIIN